jgi:hypothetical protein
MVFGQSCQSASRSPFRVRSEGVVPLWPAGPSAAKALCGRGWQGRGQGLISVLVMRCPNRGESVAPANSTNNVVINPSKIDPWKRLSFSTPGHTENSAMPRNPLPRRPGPPLLLLPFPAVPA